MEVLASEWTEFVADEGELSFGEVAPSVIVKVPGGGAASEMPAESAGK